MQRFAIATTKTVYRDLITGACTESELLDEQMQKCKELGIEFNDYTWGRQYRCHFFDSPFMDEHTFECSLWEAVQILSSKEGWDLVQYDNGNYGFIAYYSGCRNGFEIIK